MVADIFRSGKRVVGGDATPHGFIVWIEGLISFKAACFSVCCLCQGRRWITHMGELFQVLGCPDNFKDFVLLRFNLGGCSTELWESHLRTQVGANAFADTWEYMERFTRLDSLCWNVLEMLQAKLDISVGVKEVEIGKSVSELGDCGQQENIGSSHDLEVSMSIGVVRTRVLSIGVDRIGVMHRGRQDCFGCQDHKRFNCLGMGMTARVRVTTTSASTGVSQLEILIRVMLQVLQVRGGLLRLCLLHLFVLPVESLIQVFVIRLLGDVLLAGLLTQHKVEGLSPSKQMQNMPTDFARLPPTTGLSLCYDS
ncbi:hypothetical protein Tco_0596821 [Tanacetum coccineum]